MTVGMTQIITSLLGSLGFAILFEIRGVKLIHEAIGGALGWGLYLAARACGLSLFWGLFIGSLGVAALSEILARRLRTPVILLLVPMLIPMIPGGDLYYTMYYLVGRDYEAFGAAASRVMTEASAIAVGILAVSYAARLIMRMRSE